MTGARYYIEVWSTGADPYIGAAPNSWHRVGGYGPLRQMLALQQCWEYGVSCDIAISWYPPEPTRLVLAVGD